MGLNNEMIDILLVEDREEDAELIILALKKNNALCKILWVHNGQEALNYLNGEDKFLDRNVHLKPKMILLDLKMPLLNGLEFLAIIKDNPNLKHIPIVVNSTSKENIDMQSAYGLGANSYITKNDDFVNFSNDMESIGYYWVMINQSLA